MAEVGYFKLARLTKQSSVYVLFLGTQFCVPAHTFLLFSAHEFLRSLPYKNEPDMQFCVL